MIQKFHSLSAVVMAPSDKLGPCEFPPELLHMVLTRVIADCVHTVCFFPGNSEWEMNVFATLSSVSSAFRAIATELAIRTFQVQPSDGDTR